MIPESRIQEMRHWIARYGSGNCWTGTTGTLATFVHELLEERKELLEKEPPCE